jgi:hypothetical protein
MATKTDHRTSYAKPSHEQAPASKTESHKDKPYSVFTNGEKWLIVGIASIAGLFRPVLFVDAAFLIY